MPKFSAYMKGGDGSVGPPGSAFISGIVSTTNDLPTPPAINKQIFLVGDSDPKYIYAYIDGEWVNQGLTASKINEITASITTIPWATTSQPSVQTQFSTSNQLDSLNFDFVIPEAQPAGFGNISVTSKQLSSSNNPTVSITTDGEDWGKNFYFDFGIPQGVPAGFSTNHSVSVSTLNWDKPATVKITTNNNSPDTSKSFNFEFGIPKGHEAGFSTFSANIQSIGWTEDPTVSISENGPSWGKNIDFNFKVPKTRPAGFGNSTNAIISSLPWNDTPKITVTTDGEDWEKNFHFNFKIPTGRPAGFGNINITTSTLPSNENPWARVNTVTTSPDYQKEFNFEFGLPLGKAAGFSTQQNVSVSTLDTGEQATVQISTVTTSPETSKVFNFHFGLPRGDALSIYEGITFTSTQDGSDYYWKNTNGTSTLIFNRGTVEKLPIYIYNSNNESIASTFKISTTTIEYEADEKFDGIMYLMMPATLTDLEIGTVSTTTYEYPTTISKSTGSTSTKTILDFCISEGHPRYLYGVCDTAAGTVEKTVNIPGFTLEIGTTIFVKFTNANSASSPTLNVSNTGAINMYRYGTTKKGTTAATDGWSAGSILTLTYDGNGWIDQYWINTQYTIYGAYCTTGAGTAAKAASCTYYQLNPGFFEVTMRYSNTTASALTLNVASKGAKPIYINGEPSSSTNYTLPAGIYIVYYDGTNYYFRTDGKIENICEEAPKDGKAYVRKDGEWVDITTL